MPTRDIIKIVKSTIYLVIAIWLVFFVGVDISDPSHQAIILILLASAGKDGITPILDRKHNDPS
jgi:hypothetical protein